MIQTVLGAISKDEIGITTSHEHIFLDLTTFFTKHPVPGIADPETEPVKIENLGILYRDPYALYDNLKYDDYETQKQELLYFKNAGGKTIFDATCSGLGRNPVALKRMSEETGLNIICGTGYYVSSTYSDELKNMPAVDIAETMLHELNVGMDGTDIKAGYIGEIGISENMDVHERKILKAAAIAQTKSGVALSVHINPWTQNGLEAADIALAEGVKPDKIIICHMDVENNEDYILALLEKGVYVEFDNFGKEYYVRREVRNSGYGLFVRDADRVKLCKKLIEAGYLNRILLSCDVCLKILLRRYGGWGYDHCLTNIVPMMEDEGIAKSNIATMLINNPAEVFDV